MMYQFPKDSSYFKIDSIDDLKTYMEESFQISGDVRCDSYEV